MEEVKREEGEWGDDNRGQVREGMSFCWGAMKRNEISFEVVIHF